MKNQCCFFKRLEEKKRCYFLLEVLIKINEGVVNSKSTHCSEGTEVGKHFCALQKIWGVAPCGAAHADLHQLCQLTLKKKNQ